MSKQDDSSCSSFHSVPCSYSEYIIISTSKSTADIIICRQNCTFCLNAIIYNCLRKPFINHALPGFFFKNDGQQDYQDVSAAGREERTMLQSILTTTHFVSNNDSDFSAGLV